MVVANTSQQQERTVDANQIMQMAANQIMQMAADHAARAEELDVVGATVTSRHHVEFAKLYVSMAKEVRLGTTQRRSGNNYHDVMFKPVIIQPAPDLSLTAGEADVDLDDAPDDHGDEPETFSHQ